MSKAKIGIVTVSDRASAGVYEDISGKAIIDTLNDYLTSEWEPVYEVIPDEQDVIEATLIKMADEQNCSLIVTTGGSKPEIFVIYEIIESPGYGRVISKLQSRLPTYDLTIKF